MEGEGDCAEAPEYTCDDKVFVSRFFSVLVCTTVSSHQKENI